MNFGNKADGGRVYLLVKKDCQRKMLAVFSILIEVAKNYCFIQDKSSLKVGFLPCINIPTR